MKSVIIYGKTASILMYIAFQETEFGARNSAGSAWLKSDLRGIETLGQVASQTILGCVKIRP